MRRLVGGPLDGRMDHSGEDVFEHLDANADGGWTKHTYVLLGDSNELVHASTEIVDFAL